MVLTLHHGLLPPKYLFSMIIIENTECQFITGSECKLIGDTKLPFSQVPFLLYDGEVICQTQNGKVFLARI